MIIPTSDRIMTRSRARQNPEQYTVISAQLKIIKVLVDELLSASGNTRDLSVAAAADIDDDDDEEGEWEDDDFLDLGSGMTKSQLMALGAEDGPGMSRSRDDETQAYLIEFFQRAAQSPGFNDVFNALTPAEQEKLRTMSQ